MEQQEMIRRVSREEERQKELSREITEVKNSLVEKAE
jgi:hypothetical protein